MQHLDSKKQQGIASKRARTTTPLEKWQTFDRNDPSVWSDVLHGIGVDTESMTELFAMAQRDDRGWQDANDLIGKLLKFQSTGKSVQNPSAWLHSAILKKRHEWCP